MKHYICLGGCNGESDHPGVCNTEGCPNKNMPLVECDCGDGKHLKLKTENQNKENTA